MSQTSGALPTAAGSGEMNHSPVSTGDKKPLSYYHYTRREMLEFIPRDARTVLDIGCGAGEFASLLKERQPVKVWGIEPVSEAATQAATVLDRVLVGLFPSDLTLPSWYFDVVVFNDVLEHMPDPWEALRVTRGLLSERGVVVASIPNVRYVKVLYNLVFRGDWTYTTQGSLDRTHLRFFTSRTIRKLFDETGYDVVTMQGLWPNPHWMTKIMGTLAPWLISDMKYLQFAVQGRVRPTCAT